MKAEEKVEKTNSEENKEESEDEEDEENVPSTSKAEKDKMVEGQQKKKVEIAKIKVKLNILRDDLENAIRDKDFLKAQDLQLDVDDLDSKLINLNEELALMIIPPSVEKRIKTKARTEASAPAETQQGMQQIPFWMKNFFKKIFDFAPSGYLPTSAIQQTIIFRPFLFLFVNWAGQISASQTGPIKPKIKSYKLISFLLHS